MTWSRIYHLSPIQTDDLFPDRISILLLNRWSPFQIDYMSPNILCILRTNYILRMESLRLNGLFIPRTNDYPYNWLPFWMTPWTNHSTLRNNLGCSSVNKLMTWSRTDYLSSIRTDDLFQDRISILRTNGWSPFRTDDLFPNRICILRTNFYEFSWAIKTYVCS